MYIAVSDFRSAVNGIAQRVAMSKIFDSNSPRNSRPRPRCETSGLRIEDLVEGPYNFLQRGAGSALVASSELA